MLFRTVRRGEWLDTYKEYTEFKTGIRSASGKAGCQRVFARCPNVGPSKSLLHSSQRPRGVAARVTAQIPRLTIQESSYKLNSSPLKLMLVFPRLARPLHKNFRFLHSAMTFSAQSAVDHRLSHTPPMVTDLLHPAACESLSLLETLLHIGVLLTNQLVKSHEVSCLLCSVQIAMVPALLHKWYAPAPLPQRSKAQQHDVTARKIYWPRSLHLPQWSEGT